MAPPFIRFGFSSLIFPMPPEAQEALAVWRHFRADTGHAALEGRLHHVQRCRHALGLTADDFRAFGGMPRVAAFAARKDAAIANARRHGVDESALERASADLRSFQQLPAWSLAQDRRPGAGGTLFADMCCAVAGLPTGVSDELVSKLTKAFDLTRQQDERAPLRLPTIWIEAMPDVGANLAFAARSLRQQFPHAPAIATDAAWNLHIDPLAEAALSGLPDDTAVAFRIRSGAVVADGVDDPESDPVALLAFLNAATAIPELARLVALTRDLRFSCRVPDGALARAGIVAADGWRLEASVGNASLADDAQPILSLGLTREPPPDGALRLRFIEA